MHTVSILAMTIEVPRKDKPSENQMKSFKTSNHPDKQQKQKQSWSFSYSPLLSCSYFLSTLVVWKLLSTTCLLFSWNHQNGINQLVTQRYWQDFHPRASPGEPNSPSGTFAAGYARDSWETGKRFVWMFSVEDIVDLWIIGILLVGFLIIGLGISQYCKIGKTAASKFTQKLSGGT